MSESEMNVHECVANITTQRTKLNRLSDLLNILLQDDRNGTKTTYFEEG